MKTIGITGYSGFVGTNLIPYLNSHNQFFIREINLRNKPDFSGFSDYYAIIHLAGKAHDLKNVSEPDEYYAINFGLTREIYELFLKSKVKKFIFISSVKASADGVEGTLSEIDIPDPKTHYGKSKLLAEEYILNQQSPQGKSIYILRPCMIHGPGNKGNLNLLFKIVSKNIPWPLGSFENKRSFCSIDKLMFIIRELIEREDIPSGIYNVADDEPLSMNELISLIAQSQNRIPNLWKISKGFIEIVASIGETLHLPLNTERLNKLTSSYVVSNTKIKLAIGKPFPVSSRDGLLKTFSSFNP